MSRDLLILSTPASAYFADLIRNQLHQALPVKTERKTFGGGERYFRIDIGSRDQVMGKDVVFVGSTHTDEDFMELLQVGSALAMYGAHNLIFCIPFFGYSRMERADKPGEVVTAKTHARMLSAIPQARAGNTFLLMDTHVPNLVHYFEGNCLRFELKSEELLKHQIWNTVELSWTKLGPERPIFGTTDLGRPKTIKSLAKSLQTILALVDKDREGDNSKVAAVIGDVKGRTVIMYDDLCGSGQTSINAAVAYRRHGAEYVHFVVNHLSVNDTDSCAKILDSSIHKIITTNSHPNHANPFPPDSGYGQLFKAKVVVVDVSSLFVDQIRKIIG